MNILATQIEDVTHFSTGLKLKFNNGVQTTVNSMKFDMSKRNNFAERVSAVVVYKRGIISSLSNSRSIST